MSGLVKQNSLPQSFIGKAVAAVAVYTVFYGIFGGVARFGLAKIHALFINDVPGVSAFILFGAYYLHAMARRKISNFMLFLLLVILFYVVYAFAMSVAFLQALMGFYIWSYFLLGVLVCAYEKEETLFKFMMAFWVVSVFGVLLNYFWDYPWIGESYEVAGTTMQVSRSWVAAEGFQRLPGFSRASYSVAGQILLCCAYILASRKYASFLKAIVYCLSALAIFLTTSKTELGLLVLFPFVLFTYWGLRRLWPNTKAAFRFARSLIVVMVCLVILAPVTLSTHRQMNASEKLYGFISGDSFIDRMTRTWPEAFELLEKNGNPVTGRGIGGIGTGLAMMDPQPETVNPGDNLFVYLYVEGGVFLTIPFFISFFIGLGDAYRKSPEYFEIIWMVSFAVLGVSTMAASVEDSVTAMFLGFLVARGYMSPTRFAMKA